MKKCEQCLTFHYKDKFVPLQYQKPLAHNEPPDFLLNAVYCAVINYGTHYECCIRTVAPGGLSTCLLKRTD